MAKTDSKNMAPCPSCGRKIYRDVPKCPYCSTETPFKTSVGKIMALALGGVAIAVGAAVASAMLLS